MLKKYCPVVLIILLTFTACQTNKTDKNQTDTNDAKQVVNPVSIEVTKKESGNFKVGDMIEIKVAIKDSSVFDSTKLMVENNLVDDAKIPGVITWNSKDARVGKIKLSAYFYTKGKTLSNSSFVTLLSDIVPPEQGYKVIKTYPHDKTAYTQGLLFSDGIFYESTGLNGQSSLRKVKIETGEVLKYYKLAENIFGEGLVLFNDKLIQISWQNQTGFVYNKETFAVEHEFKYPTEGWGITTDGKNLIMSDGSNTLYFYNPETFEEISRIDVYDNVGIVKNLNELEYINDEIYANIYQTDKIARINPVNGKVIAYINLENLLPESDRSPDTDVLNGIAYDAKTKRLWVTGKRWSKLFEIKIN